MRFVRIPLIVAALAACAVPAFAGDWTNWRGPFQNGFSPETGLPSTWNPATGENLVWKRDFGSRSTPVVMKGRVFLLNYTAEKEKGKDIAATIQERVLCMDAESGKTIWEHKFPLFHTDIVTVRLGWTNLVADPVTGYIYGHGTQGFLICLDGMADKAKVVWQRSLTEEYGRITGYGGRVTTPILFEDLAIIGMVNSSWGDQAKGGNRFVAFDKKTGDVRWWSEPAGAVKDTFYSVPITARIGGVDVVISGGADGSVFAMKARTGEPVWRYTYGSSAINCSPVVDGDLVYIGHGEENTDTNVQGRVVCLNGAEIANGAPKLVWKVDGLTARYTAPVIHQNRLYITDEKGKLFCLDSKSGEQIWKFSYGRNSRGSPVLADGKIYIGEVNSKFHIIDATAKKPKFLSTVFFPAEGEGSADVEINGSPAVSNGRIYFATSEEFFCIGSKVANPTKEIAPPVLNPKVGPIAHLQIVPAEIALHPGETAKFTVKGYDDKGFFVSDVTDVEWGVFPPPLAPGAKAPPPPLDGEIKAGTLTIDAKKASQQGAITAKMGPIVGKARVRVAPKLPYAQDFSKIPDGVAPAGWINTQGKFVVATVDGEKLLRKVNDKASPLIARGNAYIGLPTLKDYTIESDVLGTKVGDDLPDMGVVANRYSLILAGNIQKLRLVSWDALPRVDTTIPFKIEPGVWYRVKLTTEIQNGKGVIKGKAWPRAEAEPKDWTVELNDRFAIGEGSPALYGYVTGILDPKPGNEIYYDNVRVTPNGK
jgi:outer membrane protein assembly factor BamB